jgi:hypothetical protein
MEKILVKGYEYITTDLYDKGGNPILVIVKPIGRFFGR